VAQREHRAGRLAEAAAAYRKILALRSDLVEAHNNLGIILAQQGDADGARTEFEHVLTLKPQYAEVHNNLGTVLLGQGQLDQAAARYEQALALRPDYPQAHNNLGLTLFRQGQLDPAVAHCQQALALLPNYAEAHYNLGLVRGKQGQLDQAAACYEQALALRPDYADACWGLGNLLLRQNKLDQAAARFEQTLALRPHFAEAHYDLGVTLWRQGQLDQASARFEQTLALRPAYPEACYNLALIAWAQGKYDQAAARFEQALALRPDYADAHWGRAACYLVEGDYEHGWPAHEGRLRPPRHTLPRWTGQPLAGRSLLLTTEQGLGDTLQFVRYARMLKELGARVVLACQPALGPLLASYPHLDELFIVGSAEELPRCDFYLPLLSAPQAFHTDAATIPCDVPYLAADPALTDQWREELSGVDGFKIGIVWQGSREFASDRWRSMPLAQFAPLARQRGVRLISLQKGFGSEQIATVDFPILDLSGRLDETAGPFMDTAAVIRNLDLVIAPDTGIGHLAGALGVPVWLALQFAPDWRWLRDREDSPWYPTMRLFRQTTFDRWPDVFERMADALQSRDPGTV